MCRGIERDRETEAADASRSHDAVMRPAKPLLRMGYSARAIGTAVNAVGGGDSPVFLRTSLTSEILRLLYRQAVYENMEVD